MDKRRLTMKKSEAKKILKRISSSKDLDMEKEQAVIAWYESVAVRYGLTVHDLTNILQWVIPEYVIKPYRLRGRMENDIDLGH